MGEDTNDTDRWYALWSSRIEARLARLLSRFSDLSNDDREDVLADAREYVVAALRLRQTGIRSPEAYAWTSALHFVRRRVEQVRRYQEITRPLDGSEPAEAGDPQMFAGSSSSSLVQHAIRRLARTLPEEEQSLLQRCFVEGTPVAEVARDLGVPRTTVTSRLIKAVCTLRSALLEEAGNDPRLADEVAMLWGSDSFRRLSSIRLRNDRSSPRRRHEAPE